ncbi:unnamed protein product, partial [Tenebrio molitor]
DYDLRDAFAIDKSLLLLSGYYPRRNNKNNFVYIFRAFLHSSFVYLQFLSMIAELIMARNDLSKISETLHYFMTVLTYVYKLQNFLARRRNLLDIEDRLKEPVFYGFSLDQLRQLKSEIDSCRTVGKLFRIMCVGAVGLYALVPFLDKNKAMNLPIPGWFPYNVTKYYSLTYAFQMIGVGMTAYVNSTIDILTWMLMTVASAQFNILKENLKNIDYRFGKEDGQKKIIENNFNNCVKHHKAIVDFVCKIEYTFSNGIFLQFLASVVIICATGFLMIIVPIPSMQFGLLATYFLCMMWQVGMYCWYGHVVMTTSDKIGRFAYISNWYESDLAIRKNLSIFLERTKRPVTLTAGKFVTLSLATLTSILRSSYSYFAVLQHLYNKS